MRLTLFSIAVLWALPSTAFADGMTDPDADSVCVLDPVNGATVYTTLTVVVEAVNNSALVVQEVTLRVDDVDVEGQSCDGPGTCMFDITLEPGPHTLRGFAERNIGVELFSDIINVNAVVGGGSEATGGDDGSGGGTGADGGSSGDDDSGDGCSCRTTGPGRAFPLGLGLLALLALKPRRTSPNAEFRP